VEESGIEICVMYVDETFVPVDSECSFFFWGNNFLQHQNKYHKTRVFLHHLRTSLPLSSKRREWPAKEISRQRLELIWGQRTHAWLCGVVIE
jgi:hypothetical protein